MRRFSLITAALAAILFLTFLSPTHVLAQAMPRFGLGFNVLGSTADGLGIGLTGRASAPLNADLSLGLDLGATGFVLGGRRDATWVFEPQASAIITLPPRGNRAMYYLAGLGAYLPLTSDPDADAKAGPTIHAGVGWVQTLRETTVFYEIDPALVIAENKVDLAFPFRVGIIF
ncbi:MAG TPA: hypothetical protein VFG50_12840 [Rhodothermales bacterium]|nr:hypothetical protein [Rhodothermales bacterium]